ncbi:unnamed protein product [Gordionus sp. m RMFG-2023]
MPDASAAWIELISKEPYGLMAVPDEIGFTEEQIKGGEMVHDSFEERIFKRSIKISKGSICPWAYVNNTVPNRWPPSIAEVRCSNDPGGECHTCRPV